MVSVYSLLLFCGDCLSVNLEKGLFVISIDDGWIRFSASSRKVREPIYKVIRLLAVPVWIVERQAICAPALPQFVRSFARFSPARSTN